MKRTVVLVLAAAVTLAGCGLKFLPGSISGEQISKRWVQLDFAGCVQTGTDCLPDSSPGYAGGSWPLQAALIAFRVPKETEMPYEFSSVSGTNITLTRDQAYSRELNELAPHGPNTRWVGYRPLSGNEPQVHQTSFQIQMRVPRGYSREEFGVTPVAGFTGSSAEVECGLDAFAAAGPGGTRCITDPPTKEGLEKVMIPLAPSTDGRGT